MNKIFAYAFALSIISVSPILANVNSLIEKAISGDSNSQLELAKYYEKKDYKALMNYWFEKAAGQNNIEAKEFLCQNYFNSGDTDKAFNLATEIAKNGNKIGKSVLAYYYCWGAYEVPIDKQLALKFAEESSDIPLSKAVLAEHYANGFWGIKKDYEKAISLAEESYAEGCDEGGITADRIYANKYHRLSPNHNELNDKLESSVYIDGVLNAASTYIFSVTKEPNYNKAKKMIEPYLNKKYSFPYRLMAIIESNSYNSKLAKEYRAKAVEYWGTTSVLEDFKDHIYSSRYDKTELEKAKQSVSIALQTQDPDLIAQLYFYFFEANERYKVPLECLPDNIDWKKLIKIGADNGNPVLMLLHAHNIGKEDKDYEKYLNQANEMGVIRVLKNSFNYCDNYEKWLEIGAELKDLDSLCQLGKGLIKGVIERPYSRKKLFIKVDKDKGLQFLEYAANQGDYSSAKALYEYYRKESPFPLRILSKLNVDKLTRTESKDKLNVTKSSSYKPNQSFPSWSNRKDDNDLDEVENDSFDNKEIDIIKKAYFWGNVCNLNIDNREKSFIKNIETKLDDKDLKELKEKINSYKKEIEKNKIEYKNRLKTLEENYLDLDQIKFFPSR